MIDDARVRFTLLDRFPQIEPSRFEMEDYEHGDVLGVWWRSPDGVKRVQVKVERKGEDQLVEELADLMAPWFRRPPGRPRKHAA